MMLSCQRCKQTSNGPQAFLLTCQGCNKTWHHRCHMPPVEDDDLIRRIRATNAGDTANSLSAWTCRRCRKGISAVPSATSSREPTMSLLDLHEDRKNLSSSYSSAVVDAAASTSTVSVASTAGIRVKQESSTAVDVRPSDNKSDRQKATEVTPAKRILSAKRTRASTVNRPHVQPQPDPGKLSGGDVQMADTTPTKPTPQGKRSPQRVFSTVQGKSARKFVSTVPATSSEDDVEMEVQATPPPLSESTSRATSQASQVPSSDSQTSRPESVTKDACVRVANLTSERDRGVRPIDGTVIQPRVDQGATDEIDDDPEDLYGPRIERRIIRILPSLAEELREQQRRTAVEKEQRRAPLASDWIYAEHMRDPLWKEIPTGGRKRRKPTARKLEATGLNVSELMGCFAVQNWVREHKT